MGEWAGYVTGAKELTSALSGFIFSALSVVVGVIFILRGIKKIVDHGSGANPHERVWGYISINLVTGAMLLNFAYFLGAFVFSIFTTKIEEPSVALSYLPPQVQGSEILQAGITIAIFWISVIGVISILRGIILFNSLANPQGQQQGAAWKGFWHIVFGVFAANIGGTVKLLFS